MGLSSLRTFLQFGFANAAQIALMAFPLCVVQQVRMRAARCLLRLAELMIASAAHALRRLGRGVCLPWRSAFWPCGGIWSFLCRF